MGAILHQAPDLRQALGGAPGRKQTRSLAVQGVAQEGEALLKAHDLGLLFVQAQA